MTSAELRALLVQLDLTQGRAAEILGIGDRTFRRWVSPEGRPRDWVGPALRQAAADRRAGKGKPAGG